MTITTTLTYLQVISDFVGEQLFNQPECRFPCFKILLHNIGIIPCAFILFVLCEFSVVRNRNQVNRVRVFHKFGKDFIFKFSQFRMIFFHSFQVKVIKKPVEFFLTLGRLQGVGEPWIRQDIGVILSVGRFLINLFLDSTTEFFNLPLDKGTGLERSNGRHLFFLVGRLEGRWAGGCYTYST